MILKVWKNFNKRKNSTKRPSDDDAFSIDVVLKRSTSLESPTFLIAGVDLEINYCQMGDHYYFIDDIILGNNEIYELVCSQDVLATYRTEVLNTTAFVSYSNVSGGDWLADTRVPVKKDCIVTKTSVDPQFIAPNGYYILSVLGKHGCVTYSCALSNIKALIDGIDGYRVTEYAAMLEGLDFSTINTAVEGLSKIVLKTDLLGNAYDNAPSCIRSCIWIPFSTARAVAGEQQIYLGNFGTGITCAYLKSTPITGEVNVNIPWHYSDWRRGYCEQLYLYLPMVGMVNLSTDSLTHATSVTVKYSYTCTDGAIAYQIISGNEIIGSYGGSCAANYPIGINQQASAGEIMNTMVSGTYQTIADAITSGVNIPAMAVGAVAGGLKTGYDVANTALSTHPSCIGGVGGGAGAGLDTNITLYSVAHSTVIEPSEMQNTMGIPTMKPLQLSNCEGYCQCANASVDISGLASDKDELNAYLNSGFFIE